MFAAVNSGETTIKFAESKSRIEATLAFEIRLLAGRKGDVRLLHTLYLTA